MSDDLELDLPAPPEPQSQPPASELTQTPPARPSGNAQVRQSVELPTPKAEMLYRFRLPPVPRDELIEKLTAANQLSNIDRTTAAFGQWRDSVKEASEQYTPGGLYQERFFDEDSQFLQGVEREDGSLVGISPPKFRATEGELKGESAVLKVSRKLGLGDVLSVPLPHSGIVVTLKPPTERDLIDFYNTVFREKVYVGRMSAGLTLTNMSAYLNNRLFDFIAKHIHSINYGGIEREQLRNYLLIHDFHVLAWAFAATSYPQGFDYERPCSNNIEQCQHVAKGTLNMLKLLWVDNKALTQPQKDILYEVRPGKLDVENYRKYIAEHTRVKGKLVDVGSGLKLQLKVPTFGEHISDGLGWVNRINTALDTVLSAEDDEEGARQEIMRQHVSSSLLRQFSHFVDYIESDENVIQDRDTIHSVLEVLSADDEMRVKITEEILRFKSETTIALVGVPRYKCPKCQHDQVEDMVNQHLSSVIPLDVMMLFFTLLTLRVSRILERA